MLIFLLILLVIAALLGILGAVIKVTLIIVLSLTLAVVVLGVVLWFVAKNRMNKFRATLRQYDEAGKSPGRVGHSTIEVHGYVVNEDAAPPSAEDEPPRLGE